MATMVAGGPDRDSLQSGKWDQKEDLLHWILNLSLFKNHIDDYTHKHWCRCTQKRSAAATEGKTGEKQKAGGKLQLIKLALYCSAGMKCGGKRGEGVKEAWLDSKGWALFSAVMTGVTSCSHLWGVSEVNKLAQWRNTHQREKEDYFFFTLVLPICRNIHNPAGRREEKQEGREKQKEMCWISDITVEEGRQV